MFRRKSEGMKEKRRKREVNQKDIVCCIVHLLSSSSSTIHVACCTHDIPHSICILIHRIALSSLSLLNVQSSSYYRRYLLTSNVRTFSRCQTCVLLCAVIGENLTARKMITAAKSKPSGRTLNRLAGVLPAISTRKSYFDASRKSQTGTTNER